MTFIDCVILTNELHQIFNIGAGLTVSVAAMNGLGRDLITLSDSQLAAVQKVSSRTRRFLGNMLIVTEYLRQQPLVYCHLLLHEALDHYAVLVDYTTRNAPKMGVGSWDPDLHMGHCLYFGRFFSMPSTSCVEIRGPKLS